MSKIISAEKAAELIKDGSTVAIGAMGLSGWPEEVAQAIEKRFFDTGHPRDLCIKQGCATGDWKERGVDRIGHEGLVKKWAGAHIGSSKNINKLMKENKITAHCLPQGIIVNLWREIAARRPGLITKVGLKTFVDPRLEGGKMNPVTTEDLVKLIEFEGEEYLFYKSFPVDVALIRGTTADENGNMTMDKDGWLFEALPIAQATKNSGGIVIIQVEYLAKTGTLHPKKIEVPGALVDYIVVATKKEACWQTEGQYFDPSFSGDIKIPLGAVPKLPLEERKIIARRACMELVPNAIVNMGYGLPADVATIVAEEEASNLIILTTEAGSFGGIPAPPPHFGNTYNAEAMIHHGSMFDYYDGGGLNVAYLGLAETDKYGNVNVSKFGGSVTGPGGFVNISQSAKKVIYVGSFTVGSKTKIENGKLVIVEEGKRKKFLDHVEQVTFSGKYASEINQYVRYITERAVFALENGEVTLIEIAPGIDLEKDILPHMDFIPRISLSLKVMDKELFQPVWGKLKKVIESNR